MRDTSTTLLHRWRTNCSRSQIANYKAGNLFSRWNYALGIPAVFLSAIVGTSVFVALSEDSIETWVQIVVGLLSILAAGLTALQTFLQLGERSQKFKSTAAEYGCIKRMIDQLLTNEASVTTVELDHTREQMDILAKEGPEVPQRIWQHAMKTRPTVARQDDA